MVLFEVEQKFNWTIAKSNLLRQGFAPRGYPLLQTKHFKFRVFEDTYYDTNDTLWTNGLWVRKRESSSGFFKWEAKQLQTGSSFLRSTYDESDDTHQILKMVEAIRPQSPGAYLNFGLNEFCRFKTFRHSFVANDHYTVVLDRTDFGHRVGEVEVMAEDADKAHADIDKLFKQHDWFFDTQTKPKGKLTAYFERM